jgi:hypothetical protein
MKIQLRPRTLTEWLLFIVIWILGIFVGYHLASYYSEKPHRWIGHIKERYVNQNNVVVSTYLYDIKFPIELGLTRRDIIILEDSNTVIIDDTRMVGNIFECIEK